MGFFIWAIFGCIMIGIGVRAIFQEKAVGFWANIETVRVNDIKGYNRATGKLIILYGVILVVLGVPLLGGQNTPYILLSVLGVMIETIIAMAVYNVVIAKKYQVK